MKKTYLLLLLVMIHWGFNVSALKILVTNIDPVFLTSIRIFTAGITVLLICLAIKIFRFPTKKELKIILYISLFNVILHHLAVAVGLKYTLGINTAIILGTEPVVTMILTVLLLGKSATKLRVLGFILGFIGVVVISGVNINGSDAFSIGDLFIFIGVVTQAFSFILISKSSPTLDPRLLTGYMIVFGSVVIFLLCLFTKTDMTQVAVLFSWKLGSLFLFSSLLCIALGHMIYNSAIKKVGPAETAIFINFNTFFAVVGSVLFLKETLMINHGVGFLLILSGVFMGTGALEYLIVKKNKRRAV